MTYLVYLFAITLLFVPTLVCALYSRFEYHKSLRDNFENWKAGKLVGISLFLFLSYHLLKPESLAVYLDSFLFYYLEPGMSIALIVYSKPASELLQGMSSLFSLGEDLAFIIGWIGLLFVSFLFFASSAT